MSGLQDQFQRKPRLGARRSGLLYSRWEKLYGVDSPDTLVVHAKTRDLNPTISPEIISAAMDDDPQSASAEFESRWRDDLAGYVSRDEIMACVDRGVTVRQPQAGVTVSGLDRCIFRKRARLLWSRDWTSR